MGKKAIKKEEPELKHEEVKESNVNVSNVQLQNMVKERDEEVTFLTNIVISLYDFLDDQQSGMMNARQQIKEGLRNSPMKRAKVATKK